jgi:hypothetical protein
VASLGADQAYLDGELCGVRPDGITSFSMIQAAPDSGNAVGLVFFLFDLRRVARRISFTTCFAGSFTDPIFAPSMATMGQKSSLPQPAPSASLALMPDTLHRLE